MKNKKWLILLIVAFPSFFWLILETSTINSNRLPIYGRKQLDAAGDTIYQSLHDKFYFSDHDSALRLISIDSIEYPLFALMFIKDAYREESYRLTGLWEYLNYKKQKIHHIPFLLITEMHQSQSPAKDELKKLTQHPNVRFLSSPDSTFDKINKNFFIDKPYYVDRSFFVLIDKNRRIRGYYDGRYVSELKRLIGEYQHLRLKEEKQQLSESNEIKSDR